MASEITVSCSLKVTKGKLTYNSTPTQFTANMGGSIGDTPGSVTIAPGGTTITLSELDAQGGFCRFQNLDTTNYVTIGIYDGASFHPLLELLPGEFNVVRLSRSLDPTGTGSVSLQLRANTAPVVVRINAFAK